MQSTRRFLSYGSVFMVLGLGCGDGGSGTKSASDMSKPDDKPVDTGSDQDAATETPVEMRSFRDACVAACRAQGECLGFSDSDCTSSCDAQAQALSSECVDEATAEQACLEKLTCEQAKAYGTQGRRQHAECGTQAQAYFAACTPDGGATPASCAAMCARYDACGAAQVSTAACEEKCILENGSYRDASAACSDAFLAFLGCSAQAECPEVEELAASGLAPVACNDALATMEQACGS
jgi:hypothetical protein